MHRHGVLWHGERPRNLAGGETIGLMPNQKTKGVEPRGLGKRA